MNVFGRSQWVLTAAVILGLGGSVLARSPDARGLSLLVVPERFNIVQVSFDIIDKRPVALVSYRGDAASERPVLHAWTGDQWWPISLEEYAGGHFLVQQPTRIILVGDDRLLPKTLVEASDWGPRVMSIDTTETDELLNAMGRLLAFSRSEWRWFAQRYNMEIEDLTPAREEDSWYDQMTRARQQPPRRHVDDPPLVPLVPVPDKPVADEPEPIAPVPVEPEPRPEAEPLRMPAPQPAPSSPEVPIIEATEWVEDEAPSEEEPDDEEGLIK